LNRVWITRWRDERLRKVTPATVKRDLVWWSTDILCPPDLTVAF
jgi:hypothetical protein